MLAHHIPYMPLPRPKQRSTTFIILILGFLSAMGPLSIDMYLPGFEIIAEDLNTDISKVQLSLTSYFIGIAVGQLIYGPLLDRYGRRNPLIVGMLIYIVTSIGCAVTNGVENLILFRLLQALGGCVGMVASRAMVRDFFPPTESAKVFSLLMLVIGISPVLAPSIGSFVMEFWNWHGIFLLLAVIASVMLVIIFFFLPESKGANTDISLKPKAISSSYLKVLITPQFIVYAMAGGLASGGLYAYLSGSTFVMISYFGMTEKQYGYIFAFIASALILSTQVNRFLLNKYSSAHITRIALVCQTLVGVSMILTATTGLISAPLLIGLIFLFLACQGFVFPNTSALALTPFSRLAGSASALLGCLQMALGAVSSSLVSAFHQHSTIPMVSVMALCSLSALLVVFIWDKLYPNHKPVEE